ncbi:hypothetical protein B2G71_14600 [Novosphingobium sp. PC22D]|uniref:hypothetical protein n=1 Tax=Novosphingobium sp. PC22D TaxID=1962403 RepID=UPI000BF1691C|nr:hypothetical protein [Novosphingobium sp. PC22D]PEQ12006.1 hypothetical protein B2G71_14600 [Novosphingobium sp. PC22D]
MTIRFATARTWGWSSRPGRRYVSVSLCAANDNRAEPPETNAGQLVAALRHFAVHGLSAAEQARREAIEADRTGDASSYAWWLGVCRTLDRRMAERLARKVSNRAAH